MKPIKPIIAGGVSALAMASMAPAAVTVTANGISGSYSGKGNFNNSYGGDAGTQTIAGSQRSNNGNVDAGNARSGRVFTDFILTSDLINEANLPGASVTLTFNVDSIGTGTVARPYTDGLDLRYLGVSGSALGGGPAWGTTSVGSDQADILAVTGSVGSATVTLTGSALTSIQGATAGQHLTLAFLNSAGTLDYPVGTGLEIYGFNMNSTASNYTLSVIPEPGAAWLLGLASLGLAGRRRRSA